MILLADLHQVETPWQKNIAIELMCPECKDNNITEEFSSGDMICTDCGLVLGGRIIDTRSEWRTFSNDDQNNDDPSRVGEADNPLLNGPQLHTDVQYGSFGNAAKDLSKTNQRMNMDKTQKALTNAYKEIGELCDGWQLPKAVTDLAKHLYKITYDAGEFKAKGQDVVIAGCIFIACRQSNVPRTFRETFSLTKVSKKEIGKIFKSLEKFFKKQNDDAHATAAAQGRAIDANQGYKNDQKNSSAVMLLIRYSSALGLDAQTSNVATAVAENMADMGILAGRSPLSQCAASLYFTSALMGNPKSSTEISKVLGISDGTIRTVYKFLYTDREKLVDQKWLKPQGRGNMDLLPTA